MEYITSDWHFDHKNAYGKRGFIGTREDFSTIEEMNSYIIKSINQTVSGEDTLYVLGDAAFSTPPRAYELLTQINGALVIIKGNHDSSKTLKYLENHNYKLSNGKDKFTIVEVGLRKKRNGVVYYLTHLPFSVRSYKTNIKSLCGHIHEQYADDINTLNVGIDSPEITELTTRFGQPIKLTDAMDLVDRKVT